MATKKPVTKKEAAKKTAPKTVKAAPKAVARPQGPSASACPLVLDGEIDASEFSASDCFSCSEFDCRFCRAEEGSGALQSRLFVSENEEDGEEGGWDGGFEPAPGGESEAEAEEGDDAR
jgi:hypothetical protein